MADTQRAPRVEACIQEAMEKYAGGSPKRDLTYYQNVHQDLAPLARELENALSIANARIAEFERATPPSPSTAPEVDVRHEFERWMSQRGESAVYIGDGLYSTGAVCDQAEAFAAGVELARAALASRPAEVDDEAVSILRTILTGDVGRQTLGKLARGQSTETEDGKAWLAAQRLVEQYRQGQRDAVAADRARMPDPKEISDAITEAYNVAYVDRDWKATDHWRDLGKRFGAWAAPAPDANKKAD